MENESVEWSEDCSRNYEWWKSVAVVVQEEVNECGCENESRVRSDGEADWCGSVIANGSERMKNRGRRCVVV